MLVGVVVVGVRGDPGPKKSSKSMCISTFMGSDKQIVSAEVKRSDLDRIISKYWQKKSGDLRGVFEVLCKPS